MLADSDSIKLRGRPVMSFGKTPPKLRTLLRSLVPAVANRGRFCDVRTFALFIGHARSGS